ncbi:MAG: DUF3857 domain-containing protein [Alphaproteobacteria bacterium]|nr:DUF3857 domain-containing protein [Alphaproteobacteria bacterium]MBU1516189.1 DUF3857 domain-containing protein [Alphaproteobacteria bacterium]MBU2093499.1 DUF3857 domain-containing protein [Alphaproteobacteria bacterium]MBU2152347.1 DUF3857 domain-containing protein [Alphaproteobacteria bacterium]MBU2363659.1 DUF3857 domain-containing protein [Alphaproteobacteria bacterium]
MSTPALDSTGPAVRILLQDRQLNFTTQGDSEFVEQVMQVRSPQGLAGLGNVSLAWNPDTDTVTVHHLRVRRHAETIDLLARQSFTVIRREAGLERAIVDGVLTATLQPEGLQVGDVVDMAYTVTRLDPVLQGRSERTTMLPPNTAVDRVRVRAVWDASRPLQWRAGEGLGKVKVGKSDGRVELVADLKDPPPLKFVPNVPVRFYPLRELSVSEFRDWSEISALMAPHFAKTSTLSPDSPLRAEVAKIRAASSNPNVQAAAALRLVEDQVRYLALVLNLGGYVPATADQTWARRYGDCKAKTVLLMALLHELGIEAEAALVSSSRGDGLDTRLPTLAAFDHVIVRATIAGKIYWLDGTRTGDRSLDTLRAPPFLWALPLRDKDATLVAIDQPPLGEPDTYTRLQIDASAGLDPPAPVRGEKTMSQAMNVLLGSGVTIPGLDRDKMLRQLWSSYSWIEIKSITAQTDERGVTRVLLEGTATLPFDRQAGGRSLRLREADLGAYLSLRDKDDPYPDASYPVSGYPSYEAFNLAITLPRDREGFRFEGDDVDAKVAGRAFTRKLRIEKGVATIETTERTLVREISASDARAAKPALDDLAKVRVALRAPGAYRPTPQDVAAWGRQSPDTVAGLIERGNRFLSDARNADAMADFEKAVSLDPQNSFAYANRAIGHYYGGRTDAAKADLAQAQVLDPRNYVALHAAGLIAMRENRFADAAAAFGRAADLRAGNTFALTSLIRAYVAMDDTDKALAALAELQRIAPGQGDAVTFRFNILTSAGRYAEALADVDAGLAKTPDDPELHLSRATALMLLNRRDEGYRAFARAIELKPTAMAYLTRASYRAPADIAGRLADIDAAAKLEPEMMAVVARRADALGDSGRHEEALAGLATALKAHPDNDDLLMARADVHLRAGRTAIATKAFAAIRAGAARDAQQLNALCWQQAIRGFALETALADCDAALKLEPGRADALDSRAFVLMRLGRLTEAVAAYDTALKARPRLAESLYGRALARLRLNDLARGESDLAAARASDPQIEATFATYGVMLPTPAPPPRT